MSKNIVIQEGGVGKQMTVHKLKTDLVEGGTCLWVPEDETRLVTKTVTENGTYTATEDGAYGYSVVNVRVAGGNGSANPDGTPSTSTVSPGGSGSAVVGRDPTTGNDFAVGVDEDGDLVETLVPSSLEVTRPPTRVGYADGDTIDYSGIEARLLCGDGTVFTDEEHPSGYTLYKDDLTFPVTTADASSVSDMRASSDLDVGIVQPIILGSHAMRKTVPDQWGYYRVDEWTGAATFGIVSVGLSSNKYMIVASATSQNVTINRRSTVYRRDGTVQSEQDYPETLSTQYTVDGKTVYYYRITSIDTRGASEMYPYTPQNPDSVNSYAFAWTSVYGEISGGTEDVPVQWTSTFDGRVFEDSVQLHVTSGGDSSGDSGTTSGGDSGSGDIGGNDDDFSGGGGGF